MDPNNRFGAFYGGTREDLLRAYRDQHQGLYDSQRPQVDQAYAAAWEQRRQDWEKAAGVLTSSMVEQQRGGSSRGEAERQLTHAALGPQQREEEWTNNGEREGGAEGMVLERRPVQNVVQLVHRQQDSKAHVEHEKEIVKPRVETNDVGREGFDWSAAKKAIEDNSLNGPKETVSDITAVLENQNDPKEEASIDEDSFDVDEEEKWLNTTNEFDAADDDDGEEEFKTVAGWVYLNTWQLQPDLSIQYAIRFDQPTPEPGHSVQVGDVFVNLDEAIKLLTSVSGQVKVKPPNIKTIWTITVAGEDLDFCPLTEFVYHAALKASGKKFKKVYEGILNEIIRNLYSSSDLNENDATVIKEYTEKNYSVNDYFDGTGGNQRQQQQVHVEKVGRKSKRKTEDFLGWSHMEDMLDDELSAHDNRGIKVEVKLEPGGNDKDWDHRKSKKAKIYDCNLCDKSYSKNISLYRHQLQAHPHQPESHIEKPESVVKHDERVKMEKENGGRENTEPDNEDYGPYERVGSFRCKECNKPFIRLMILINHCRREHPDRPEICPEEPLKLGLLDTLHERSPMKTTEGDTFTCGLSLCNLKFDRYLSLVDHERTHSEAFICILCGLCCYSAENLIGHSDQQHARKSEFVCRVCGFFNRKADSLKTHVQQEHMQGAVMFQCEECPYNTEKKQSLHNHKRTAHREQEFYCDICGKNYASGASLYVHKKSHDPDFKKFQCKLCPAKFAYSSGLSYHMAVHTGEKPFQCNQCGSNFGSHTALSRHVKVLHAEEKDMVFQCEHCGKKFPKRMSREYRDHVKVHTGERDHICSICGSGYFSRKMLRKHELKKHAHILPKKAQPVRINPENVPQLTVTPNAAGAALQQGALGVS